MQGDIFVYDVIGISEIYQCQNDSRLSLPGYHKLISRCRSLGNRGGVGIFIKDSLNYCIRQYISIFIPHICETVFIEIKNDNGRNTIVWCIGWTLKPHADIDIFSSNLEQILDIIQNENHHCLIMGDMNIDLLKFDSHRKTSGWYAFSLVFHVRWIFSHHESPDSETSGEKPISHGKPYKMHFLACFTL